MRERNYPPDLIISSRYASILPAYVRGKSIIFQSYFTSTAHVFGYYIYFQVQVILAIWTGQLQPLATPLLPMYNLRLSSYKI